MKQQIELFIEYCHLIKTKCVRFKDKFPDKSYSTLFETDTLVAAIYFSDNYETWSITCGGIKYSNFQESVEIKTNVLSIEKISDGVNLLSDFYTKFDDIYKPKRRKLNFMK